MDELILILTIAVGAIFVGLAFSMLSYVKNPTNWLRPKRLGHRSIRTALDTLDDGILFCKPDGAVLLCSETMRTLAELLCGGVPQNGVEFWNAVGKLESTENLQILPWKGGYLLRFQGGNTWLIRKAESETLLQIAAQNITDLDRMEHNVRAKTAERDALKPQFAAVQVLQSEVAEEETQLSKSFMTMTSVTQKMAALYHFFTEHYALPAETFDYKKLASLTAALTEDLTFPDENRSEYELAVTVSALRLLGVTVDVKGALPTDRAIADAFEKIIREASVNAILHGNATTVVVTIEEDEQEDIWKCRIVNNGAPLKDTLSPGGGITGMRRALFPLSGTLTIRKKPIFVITATVPRKCE